MATTILGLTELTQTSPINYLEINENLRKIDSGVAKAMRGAAAWNLLDNSYFPNAVNQRGATSQSGSLVWFIDRWRINTPGGVTAQLVDGGILMQADTHLLQTVDAARLKLNQMYTLAFKTEGGVFCKSGRRETENGTFIWMRERGMVYQMTGNGMDIENESVTGGTTVEWAALYEGEYTPDTLPDYVPKGYAAELAECQRYYWRSQGENWGLCTRCMGDGSMRMPIAAPRMRVVPSAAGIGFQVFGTGGWETPVTLDVSACASGYAVVLGMPTPDNYPAGSSYLTTGGIELIAEV